MKKIMSQFTGPTLPQGKNSGCAYQILRIEPNKTPRIYRRELIERLSGILWEKTSDSNKRDSMQFGLKWRDLTEGVTPVVSEKFLGCSDKEGWAVISHCESGKFQNYGILSPGEIINSALIQHFNSSQGNLVRAVSGFEVEYPPGTEKTGKHTTAWSLFEKQCVFLVDSPRYNHYVGWVLEHYSAYLAGASVEFRDNTSETPHRQEIVVCGKVFSSEGGKGDGLFGAHSDYLLIMRLPGLVPSRPESIVNRMCPDPNKTIWVVAGIHSKASQAGSVLFKPENLPFFVETLMRQCGGDVPEYFEVVYKIPSGINRPLIDQKDLTFLKKDPIHFHVLRLKTDIAMADGQPSGIAARFRRDGNWANIPLEIIHLDPVAACNHNCETCIEKDLREQRTCLSLATCLKVLCDLKSVGCRRVNLYGGEPTLHPDFPELLRTICAMGFETLIVTNGSRLPEGKIRKTLIDCRKNIQIRVSLDACSNETHEKYHGIPGKSNYEKIVSSTKSLIREGIHTTISILMHPNVVKDEKFIEVCEDWENSGAQALVLRPVTDVEGKNANLNDFDDNSIQIIVNMLQKWGKQGFIQISPWFEEWLRNPQKHEESNKKNQSAEPKEYDTCYSAYYRMVISPKKDAKPGEKREVDGVEMHEVSTASLIWCSYRRQTLNENGIKYGEDYPDDLAIWLQNKRLSLLENLNPNKHCGDIYCCRHALNKELYESMI
jgi:pyruvate-formate lyase-activating enzyme